MRRNFVGSVSLRTPSASSGVFLPLRAPSASSGLWLVICYTHTNLCSRTGLVKTKNLCLRPGLVKTRTSRFLLRTRPFVTRRHPFVTRRRPFVPRRGSFVPRSGRCAARRGRCSPRSTLTHSRSAFQAPFYWPVREHTALPVCVRVLTPKPPTRAAGFFHNPVQPTQKHTGRKSGRTKRKGLDRPRESMAR